MKYKIHILLILVIFFISIASANYDTLSVDSHTINDQNEIDWWPMYKHDSSKNAFTTSSAPDNIDIIWNTTYQIDEIIVYKNMVFGYSNNSDILKSIISLNATTGKTNWETAPLYHPLYYLTAYNNTLFGIRKINLVDKIICCLSIEDGKEIWNISLGSKISTPVINNHKMYIIVEGTSTETIFCLNANDGSLIWKFVTSDNIRSSPVIDEGNVCVSINDNVYCLNAENGNIKWKKNYSSLPLMINEGSLFLGYNRICNIDVNTGNLIWSTPIPYDICHAVSAYDKVFICSNYMNAYRGYLFCLDEITGEKIWEKQLSGGFLGDLVVADNKVFVATIPINLLNCFNTENGDLIWSYDLNTGFGIPIVVIAHDRLYLSCYSLHCIGEKPPDCQLNIPNGRILFRNKSYLNPFSSYTFLIGSYIIKANASDNMGIDRVEFYINSELVFLDDQEPYKFQWDETVFGKFNIKIIAYDNAQNYASDEIDVWKLF